MGGLKNRKYRVGQVVEGKKVIGYRGRRYIVECQDCGLIYERNSNQISNFCRCRRAEFYTRRFSGLHYLNPPEKIEAIKEKYRNGVTAEILDELLGKVEV